MFVINARNVNDAWAHAKDVLNGDHIARPSRYGDVWEWPEPVTTVYMHPTQRVLFDPRRNCNPYFHIFEALWALAGRNDVPFLAQFNSRVNEFSDDGGKTWHDAYGYRWRNYFDLYGGAELGFSDQIARIVKMLRKSEDERRCVLQMWDSVNDLDRPDLNAVPCNTHVYFKITHGKLRMTVCCRSNDVVFGCYGSNQVVFSMLQEYVASMLDIPVGNYYQISDSWHAYTRYWEQYGGPDRNWADDPYRDNKVRPFPMVADPESWYDELLMWMKENGEEWLDNNRIYSVEEQLLPAADTPVCYKNGFFPLVAQPLLNSWKAYKAGDMVDARDWAGACYASDWRLACFEWLQRIQDKRAAKAAQIPQNLPSTAS